MKRISILFLSLFLVVLTSCHTVKITTTLPPIPTDTTESLPVKTLMDENIMNPNYIRTIGRTYYNATDHLNYFYFTASGFIVQFYGTELTATFYTSNTTHSSSFAVLTASIDGEDFPNQSRFILNQHHTPITFAKGLPLGQHTIEVLKQSEPQDALTALSSLSTDGTFLNPTEANPFKIQFIGASGISGHGSLGTAGQPRTTLNSSSIAAFGYLTARMFDADFQFISNSGWGIKWGYNPTNHQGDVNIRTAYDYVGIDTDESIIQIPYDLQTFVPDVVVFNIGGNDFNAYVNTLTGQAKTLAINIFKSSVQEYITYLKTNYPNVYILWTYTLNSKNGAAATEAIKDLPEAIRNRVYPLIIPGVGDSGDPIGADNHASLTTHIRIASVIADKISEITGKTFTKNNIN